MACGDGKKMLRVSTRVSKRTTLMVNKAVDRDNQSTKTSWKDP